MRFVKVDYAYAHLRVGLSYLGVACLVEISVLPHSRIDREHGDLRLVEAIERQFAPVRAPPECPVAGRTPENLFIVHPGGIAVQDDVRTIIGQAQGVRRCGFADIQVIIAGKCEAGGIGVISQIDYRRQ